MTLSNPAPMHNPMTLTCAWKEASTKVGYFEVDGNAPRIGPDFRDGGYSPSTTGNGDMKGGRPCTLSWQSVLVVHRMILL